MYAKLFSRIAQSSLMEEPIETRYTFMMLLAIADQSGDVIGTDVALARTINLPLATFTKAAKALMEPDPQSNSQDQEGRRLVPSDNGRGYRIVNYTAYRAIKTAEEKKTYMREYMRARRESLKAKDVTPVNICKPALSDVTHTEAEADTEGEAEAFKKKTKARGTIEEVVEFAKSIGLPESDGEYLFHKWEGNGWTNGGSPVKNWKATIRSWVKGKFLPSQKAPAEKPGSSKSYLSSVNGYNERTDF
jgi:hypothetical protein